MSGSQPTLNEQKRFWNWHWQHWQERRTVNEWKNRRHDTMLNYLRSLSLRRPVILDLGCGPGWYTEKLSTFGPTTGIDLSEEAISMAKSRFPHITFIAGNLYDYPLPAAHFDVVFSQEVFDHVEDQLKFLERVAHLLKPGGHLILSSVNKFVMDRLEDGEFPSQPPEHIAEYLSKEDLKTLLRSQFNILRMQSILPVVGKRGILRWINSYRVNRLFGLFVPHHYLDALKELAGLGYQFIVLAQKKR